MVERVYLNPAEFAKVKELVRQHGLRPVIDAVAAAAAELVEADEPVLNEYGDARDAEDVAVSIAMMSGDLY